MKLKNHIFTGANNRLTLMDLELPRHTQNDLVLLIHGYKGFKDWGAWNLVQEQFVEAGIGFCKINLSHNGGTIEQPIDFPDLMAFGLNRYSFELEDIQRAISAIDSHIDLSSTRLHLMGHSRGGAGVLLSGKHPQVNSIITWASIADIGSRFPTGKALEEWKKIGVRYVENARTNQQMPHLFSFYEDWINHKELLHIETIAQEIKQLEKPCLHIHGTQDEAVSVDESKKIASWTAGELVLIENTGHTFGTSHPWIKHQLPEALQTAVNRSLHFINKQREL